MRPCNLNWSRENDLSQYLRVYSKAFAMIDSMSENVGKAPNEKLQKNILREFNYSRIDMTMWPLHRSRCSVVCNENGKTRKTLIKWVWVGAFGSERIWIFFLVIFLETMKRCGLMRPNHVPEDCEYNLQ